jgi:mitogen-activated protein kinase 15
MQCNARVLKTPPQKRTRTRTGLKYMHSGELLHRDIKPSNLLLNAECQVKVADYGLARSVAALEAEAAASGAGGPILTDYVATRWYRAPEILLGSTRYTFGVDLWSAGCILAELLSGRPAFPGASTLNQLDRIMEVTGGPSGGDLASIGSPFAATMLESLPPAGAPRPLRELFPGAPPEALDLLKRLLVFNPARRLSAEEALRHPYVSQFHNPADEPRAEGTISIPIDDNTRFGVGEYRDKLYGEIVKRKKELRRRMREREAAKAAADAAAAHAAAQQAAQAAAGGMQRGYGGGRAASPVRGGAPRAASPSGRASAGAPQRAASPQQQRASAGAPAQQQYAQAQQQRSGSPQRASSVAPRQQPPPQQQQQQPHSSQQTYAQMRAAAEYRSAPQQQQAQPQRGGSGGMAQGNGYGRAAPPAQQQQQQQAYRHGGY